MSNKVTYIEELFDLDDVRSSDQQSMQGYPPRMNQNFERQIDSELSEREVSAKPMQSKIRKGYDHRLAANAGMAYEVGPPQEIIHYNNNNNNQNRNKDFLLIEPDDYEMGPRARGVPDMRGKGGMGGMHDFHLHPQSISCIDIARHIKHCPICIKFYDNDRSMYIITIIVLVVICIILLKKLLENISPSRA